MARTAAAAAAALGSGAARWRDAARPATLPGMAALTERVARLEGEREHLASRGDLYRALLLLGLSIIGSQVGIALLIVRAVS